MELRLAGLDPSGQLSLQRNVGKMSIEDSAEHVNRVQVQ